MELLRQVLMMEKVMCVCESSVYLCVCKKESVVCMYICVGEGVSLSVCVCVCGVFRLNYIEVDTTRIE